MNSINAAQDLEVSFLSGITAQGRIAGQSFWTWNGDEPATYASTSLVAKWGAPAAGTGATVTYVFDAASNWSAGEQSAFVAAMHLWSEVANITFVAVGDASAANVVISRGSDRSAETDTSFATHGGAIGSGQLGTLHHADVSIDTSVAGFGPIGASLAVEGGYPWETIVHEFGHVIGLGHAGAYDEGETTDTPMQTGYDDTAASIMSYNAATDGGHHPAIVGTYSWGAAAGGLPNVAITPMMLDILAAQRLYGVATSTPLSGGQVFGFNSNIQGDTRQFFDFSVNKAAVATLFDTGTGNTLDLSGFSTPNTVSLVDGTYSSVGGLQNNLAIAFGTHIDTAIGGRGSDAVRGNDDGDYLMGNAGSDTLTGGNGNDHIFGAMISTQQGAVDGDDMIGTGAGTNYVNGNGGNDTISVTGDVNRVYGGAGSDMISIDSGNNHVNGNVGNDVIRAEGGVNDIRGGQGDDRIQLDYGNNVAAGDTGNDTILAGSGVDVLTGGQGTDVFYFDANSSPTIRYGDLAGYHDEITDFEHGIDKIEIGSSTHDPITVLHATNGQSFGTVNEAAAYAATLFDGRFATVEVSSLQVGDDAYLFFDGVFNRFAESAVKLDGVAASQIDAGDFLA